VLETPDQLNGQLSATTPGQPLARHARAVTPDPKRAMRQGLLVVAAGFVVSRLAYAAVGVRFNATDLHPKGANQDLWQMLDTHLLSHELVQSLWHLQSQPPLFNLFCGILLHLPLGLQDPLAAACFWLLGFLLACSTYLLMVELRVPSWVAAVVSLVIVANPASILYENWLSWSYPSASLLTIGAYCCVRFMKTRHTGWGVGCFSCFGLVVLDNSTFQWVWLVAVLAVILYFMRPAWRQVLLVAAVPLLLVGGWYVKNAVLFGSSTTSSWLGMNLTTTTTARASLSQLQKLVHEGRLTSLATKPAFGPVGIYDPLYVRTKKTGVPSLDAWLKSDGTPNYNNLAYVAVSNQFLHNDLTYIRADPGAFVHNVALSAAVWVTPADQYPIPTNNFYGDNTSVVSGYTNAYDAAILWQFHADEFAGIKAAATGAAPSLGTYSYATVLEYLLALLVAPIVIVRRRQARVLAGTMAVLWVTVAYNFVVTSVVSLGENNRFQFELGSLPLVLAVAVVVSIIGSARHPDRSAAGDERSRTEPTPPSSFIDQPAAGPEPAPVG
jgi:hypothetical protein